MASKINCTHKDLTANSCRSERHAQRPNPHPGARLNPGKGTFGTTFGDKTGFVQPKRKSKMNLGPLNMTPLPAAE